MIYLITYDIPQTPLRGKIAKMCENYGFKRIQYSVFLGSTSQNLVETFSLQAKEALKGQTGQITIIPVCRQCYEKIISFGTFPAKTKGKRTPLKQLKLFERKTEVLIA